MCMYNQIIKNSEVEVVSVVKSKTFELAALAQFVAEQMWNK